MTRTRLLVVALLVLRAYLFVYGDRLQLIPDSLEYATGHAWWSSPIGALAGYLGGYAGLQLFAFMTAAVLAALVVAWGGAIAGLLFLCLPLTMCSTAISVDAAGTIAYLLVVRSRQQRWIPLVALVHLVAALELAVYYFGRLLLRRRLTFRATLQPVYAASTVALTTIAGLGACIGEHHWQPRYLLPAATLVTIAYGPRVAARARTTALRMLLRRPLTPDGEPPARSRARPSGTACGALSALRPPLPD